MKEYVKALRRWFHAHPELSGEEYETCEKICQELQALGIPFKKAAGTSIVAEIEGAKPGGKKTVYLRADMDALPVTEKTGAPYQSLYEGKMHACGHDAHGAMLLGAAKELMTRRQEFAGRVRLIFQAAEETLTGAKALIEEGAVEEGTCILGIHVMAGLPVGTYHAPPGAIMTAGGGLEVNVKGRGGHASTPHASVNPILVLNHIMTAVNGFLANQVDATNYFVMTPTLLSAGVKTNVIPGEGSLYYNWRYFDQKYEEILKEKVQPLIEDTARICGAEAQVTYIPKTLVVNNDADCCGILQEAVKRRYSGQLCEKQAPPLGSEDFAYYLKKMPGVFVMLGAMPADQVPRNAHNENFDIHEDALEIGVGLYAEFALCALETPTVVSVFK